MAFPGSTSEGVPSISIPQLTGVGVPNVTGIIFVAMVALVQVISAGPAVHPGTDGLPAPPTPSTVLDATLRVALKMDSGPDEPTSTSTPPNPCCSGPLNGVSQFPFSVKVSLAKPVVPGTVPAG